MEIDKDKKYKTYCGDNVIIYNTEAGGKYPVHAAIHFKSHGRWIMNCYTLNGESIVDDDHYKIVEIGPYDHIHIDNKVLVWDEPGDEKLKQYFARVSDDGKPMAWDDGATSWSSENRATSWTFCELENKW